MQLLKSLVRLPIILGILVLPIIWIAAIDAHGAKATEAITKISIVPESKTVDVMQSFYANVTVTNVTDLTGWQMFIHYNPAILDLTNITLPAGHVFDGKYPMVAIPEDDTESRVLLNKTAFNVSNPIGTRWYGEKEEPATPEVESYKLDGWWDEDESQNLTVSDLLTLYPRDKWIEVYTVTAITQVWGKIVMKVEIAHAVCYAGIYYTMGPFNGSGTLCRLEFTSLSRGNSTLKFFLDPSMPGTELYNPAAGKIPFEAVNSNVTVVAPEKVSSNIMLETNTTSIESGTEGCINGTLTPARNNVDIFVWSQYDGIVRLLNACKTDSQGHFATVWNASNPGQYMFKATWFGDWDTSGVESLPVNVTVTGVFYVFDIKLGEKVHSMIASCNSTITRFTYNKSLPGLTFNVHGDSNTTGYCDIAIPNTFLMGNPWHVTVDGESLTFQLAEYATLNVLYFTYDHIGNMQQVAIEATWVIPEFPLHIILLLLMPATSLMTLIWKYRFFHKTMLRRRRAKEKFLQVHHITLE